MRVKIPKDILTLSENNMLKCLIGMVYLKGHFLRLVKNGGINNPMCMYNFNLYRDLLNLLE